MPSGWLFKLSSESTNSGLGHHMEVEALHVTPAVVVVPGQEGWQVSKKTLEERFHMFQEGRWNCWGSAGARAHRFIGFSETTPPPVPGRRNPETGGTG